MAEDILLDGVGEAVEPGGEDRGWVTNQIEAGPQEAVSHVYQLQSVSVFLRIRSCSQIGNHFLALREN